MLADHLLRFPSGVLEFLDPFFRTILAIQQFAALTYDELVESREAGWQI